MEHKSEENWERPITLTVHDFVRAAHVPSGSKSYIVRLSHLFCSVSNKLLISSEDSSLQVCQKKYQYSLNVSTSILHSSFARISLHLLTQTSQQILEIKAPVRDVC